jgi:beta-lactamase regulating signal transducer with metallopeptidase domain
MTLAGTLALLLYTFSLAAFAVWGLGLSLGFVLSARKSAKPPKFSSNTWFLMGISPLLLGVAVVGSCFTSALLKGFGLIPDHCQLHPGHPHLCWVHADLVGPSSALVWGVAAAAGLTLVSILRVGRSLSLVSRTLNETRLTPPRRSRRTEEENRDTDGFVSLPSEIPTAFVAGVFKPRIYLTSAAVGLLGREALRIVVTHEREHLRRRDPLKLALLRFTAYLFPGFRRVEEKWRVAAEIECDWACLERGADAVQVSETILKLARPVRHRPTLAYAAGPEVVLRERVERLLSGVGPRRSGRHVWTFVTAAVLATVAALSRLHHLLETALGPLSG